jgi:methylmalonyl-CoA mutase C-terminal domain/subunit
VNHKKRVVIGKIGLDSHDVGVRYVSKKLVEHGFEVIFIQFYQPSELVNILLQEDADAVGINFMTGGYFLMIEKIIEEMKISQLNIPLIVGGIIPVQDHQELKAMGVHEVFSTGSAIDDIIDCFKVVE